MNALVALAWPNHVHHGRAQRWFAGARAAGWATCPLTESGFVRVSSNTRAIPDARTPGEAIDLLGKLRRLGEHTFWHDDVSPVHDAAGIFPRVVGYRQVTDAHLLSLATARGGVLATFDPGLPDLAGEHAGSVELIP